ncbi:transposase [Kitasatospora sp. NPDC059571]|uniref:transposase n=1 Tax=Kitasatospora sp. NPDC059571 TaxID=3346871 RepID=UPI0036B29589
MGVARERKNGHRLILRDVGRHEEETDTTTAPDSLPPAALPKENLAPASPDLLRAMAKTFTDAATSADIDRTCGGEYRRPSKERVNSRNRQHNRDRGIRVGAIDQAIPGARSGTYFPSRLLERRRRAEQALISTVATCRLLGAPTSRVEKPGEGRGHPARTTALSRPTKGRPRIAAEATSPACVNVTSTGTTGSESTPPSPYDLPTERADTFAIASRRVRNPASLIRIFASSRSSYRLLLPALSRILRTAGIRAPHAHNSFQKSPHPYV